VKKPADSSARLRLAAVGLEAELSLYIDDAPERPEAVFGSPRAFIRGDLLHRVGTSYQLPTGAAVYFDTGVIEIATPLIELERGCIARAGRSLWESICFVRGELDAWEARSGRRARLAGFSTHYNVSIDAPLRDRAASVDAAEDALGDRRRAARHVARRDALARLLTYVLPAPVMLLAANRESTGVGVRPRGDRIEITADFTPDPTLMVAAGSLVTGVIREMATWPSFDLAALRRRGLPHIRGFRPMPHTSRKGWLARFDCYPANPFTSDANRLRPIAARIFNYFRRPIARVADPFSLRLIGAVLSGRAASYLDLDARPAEYDDVGRVCRWEPFYSDVLVERSRLEQIVMHALSGDKLRLDGSDYTPTGMQGWSRIVFTRDADGQRRVVPLEDLLEHLPDWGHSHQ
jgi:hypothetical protein